MLITAFVILAVIGIGWGLFGEITAQRRVGRMAKTFRAGGKKA